MMDVACDTKTSDNVFVKVTMTVLYAVIPEKSASANYKLSDPRSQIRSYVFDSVRSTLPRQTLDDAFASKDTVAGACKDQLKTLMTEYGFEILDVLVTDLEPDRQVKYAMNEINASSRLRAAAAEKAEGEKILQVKAAEADADAKYLSGLGVARQRKAVVDGLRDTVNRFSEEVSGASANDVMDLLLVTQYFDMIKEVGIKGKTNNTMFLPHGPSNVNALREDIRKCFMSGLK